MVHEGDTHEGDASLRDLSRFANQTTLYYLY